MATSQIRPAGRLTKFQALCAQLNDLAQNLGPEAKLPTVLQLRDTMGVSIATLNNALTELETQNIIYRKHGVGIFVSPKLNQKSISLVCDPSFFRGANISPFWDMLVEQTRQRAAAHNEAFNFHFAMPGSNSEVPLQDGFMNDIRSGRVHGVLSVGLIPTVASWIIHQQVPLVAFAGYGRWAVELDGQQVIQLGVNALAKQGCQRIGLWHPVNLYRSTEGIKEVVSIERETFRNALNRRKLPYVPELVKDNIHLVKGEHPSRQLIETNQEQGYRTAFEVFGNRKGVKPDSIMITDDMMAHGALVALQNLGVQVGQDVKVATHANRGSDVLIGREDDLTLVEIDPAEVAQAMFEMLQCLMEGKTPPQQHMRIKPKIRR